MRKDVIEEFYEASLLGARDLALELSVRFPFGQDPPDAAARFLQATEEQREVIRAQPRPRPVPCSLTPTAWKRYGIITLVDAEYIRRMIRSGVSRREMARRYNVAPITIQRIINGKTFRPDRQWASPHERRTARAHGGIQSGPDAK